MANVAGVDGAPGGWAVIQMQESRWSVQRVTTLAEFIDSAPGVAIIAIDIPIGLLDAYEVGGRQCDREARAALGKRASSVFPAPIRSVLPAATWENACAINRASAPGAKAMSKQAFGILRKVKEIDDLLQGRPELRSVLHEVHPELCFSTLAGQPMGHQKSCGFGP